MLWLGSELLATSKSAKAKVCIYAVNAFYSCSLGLFSVGVMRRVQLWKASHKQMRGVHWMTDKPKIPMMGLFNAIFCWIDLP